MLDAHNRTGKAGVTYFMPLSLPSSKISRPGSVRLISVTPPGSSSKAVLENIIPDLVRGCFEDIEAVDALGEVCRVFSM